MSERLGGTLAGRPLHFIWIVDCSGSMRIDGKVESLNEAIRNVLPEMRRVAAENPNAEIKVRVLTFSNGAQWHVAQPTRIESFVWQDVQAQPNAVTDMGKALSLLADQMKIPPMDSRALPPVLVLVSDGQPTDDFNMGLRALMEQNWGRKAVRLGIAIGRDADREILEKFTGHSEIPVLEAHNAEQLVARIRWASTAVLGAVSRPASQSVEGATQHTPVPIPVPQATPPASDEDVW